MRKIWLAPFIIILLTVVVNAQCGDDFCNVLEGEDCDTCPSDCLCTMIRSEKVDCCVDFDCKECEKGYCNERNCDSLTGFTSIYKKVECLKNGSIEMEIDFQELDSYTLTPGEDLKVYMKKKGTNESFEEITGTWLNPSKHGEYRYTKIADTSYFFSDADIFKQFGNYYIKVKYKLGMSSSIFEETEVICPGVPAAIITEPEPEPEAEPEPEPEAEPEPEPIEPSEEAVDIVETEEPEPVEPAEELVKEEEVPVTVIKPPEGKSNLIWYIVTGLIILALILFFVRYEIRVIKKRTF